MASRAIQRDGSRRVHAHEHMHAHALWRAERPSGTAHGEYMHMSTCMYMLFGEQSDPAGRLTAGTCT